MSPTACCQRLTARVWGAVRRARSYSVITANRLTRTWMSWRNTKNAAIATDANTVNAPSRKWEIYGGIFKFFIRVKTAFWKEFQNLKNSGAKPYKCKMCSKAYGIRQSLRYHMQNTHGIREQLSIDVVKEHRTLLPLTYQSWHWLIWAFGFFYFYLF